MRWVCSASGDSAWREAGRGYVPSVTRCPVADKDRTIGTALLIMIRHLIYATRRLVNRQTPKSMLNARALSRQATSGMISAWSLRPHSRVTRLSTDREGATEQGRQTLNDSPRWAV